MGRLSIVITTEKSQRNEVRKRRKQLHDVQAKIRRMAKKVAKDPFQVIPIWDAYTEEGTAQAELDYLQRWECRLVDKLMELEDECL